MKTILALLAVLLLFAAGCGGGGTFNVSERFSAEVGEDAACREEGFEEIAGEREMTYTCSYGTNGINYSNVVVCVVIVDNEFYTARMEEC